MLAICHLFSPGCFAWMIYFDCWHAKPCGWLKWTLLFIFLRQDMLCPHVSAAAPMFSLNTDKTSSSLLRLRWWGLSSSFSPLLHLLYHISWPQWVSQSYSEHYTHPVGLPMATFRLSWLSFKFLVKKRWCPTHLHYLDALLSLGVPQHPLWSHFQYSEMKGSEVIPTVCLCPSIPLSFSVER